MLYTSISALGMPQSGKTAPQYRSIRKRVMSAEAQRRARQARLFKLIEQCERDEIEAVVEGLLVQLDLRDGDADLEDATGAEDAFEVHAPNGPGCPASDNDHDRSDERDASFPEWMPWQHTRFTKGLAEALQHEDAEDPDDDRCEAGEDHLIGGPVMQVDLWRRYAERHEIGDRDDQERSRPPAYQIDKTRPLIVTAANDWPDMAA